MTISGVSAVDLFCGIGGVTHGLIRSGIDVRAGFDLDGTCRYAYEKNNATGVYENNSGARFFESDVGELKASEIIPHYSDAEIRILAGCAPCQPFSSYTQNRLNKQEDVKWGLLRSFARLVREVSPDIVAMENVVNLMKHEPYDFFLGTLEELGYHPQPHVVHCEEYGMPQNRTRLVLMGSRFGKLDLLPPTPSPTDVLTVDEAIRGLEPIEAGGTAESDPLHHAARLSPTNLKRIRQSKPGGSWKDWESGLRAPCHDKGSGWSYPAVYGRMEWKAPSPTITTQFYNYGSGRFGHPDQDRALSLREGALLQSFPKEIRLLGSRRKNSVETDRNPYRQRGSCKIRRNRGAVHNRSFEGRRICLKR